MPNDKQTPWSTGSPKRQPDVEVRRAMDESGRVLIKPNFFQKTIMKFVYHVVAPYVKNWRTTLVGIPMLFGGLSQVVDNLIAVGDGKYPTLESWQIGTGLVLAGIAAILGKDAKETGLAKK